MDEIERIIRNVPGKWQAYEAVKRFLQEKTLTGKSIRKALNTRRKGWDYEICYQGNSARTQ